MNVTKSSKLKKGLLIAIPVVITGSLTLNYISGLYLKSVITQIYNDQMKASELPDGAINFSYEHGLFNSKATITLDADTLIASEYGQLDTNSIFINQFKDFFNNIKYDYTIRHAPVLYFTYGKHTLYYKNKPIFTVNDTYTMSTINSTVTINDIPKLIADNIPDIKKEDITDYLTFDAIKLDSIFNYKTQDISGNIQTSSITITDKNINYKAELSPATLGFNGMYENDKNFYYGYNISIDSLTAYTLIPAIEAATINKLNFTSSTKSQDNLANINFKFNITSAGSKAFYNGDFIKDANIEFTMENWDIDVSERLSYQAENPYGDPKQDLINLSTNNPNMKFALGFTIVGNTNGMMNIPTGTVNLDSKFKLNKISDTSNNTEEMMMQFTDAIINFEIDKQYVDLYTNLMLTMTMGRNPDDVAEISIIKQLLAPAKKDGKDIMVMYFDKKGPEMKLNSNILNKQTINNIIRTSQLLFGPKATAVQQQGPR